MDSPCGSGTAVFTRDGNTAHDFAARINVGTVGDNVLVALACHRFGGSKASALDDLYHRGTSSIRFWTRTKTVTARWPGGIKEGV